MSLYILALWRNVFVEFYGQIQDSSLFSANWLITIILPFFFSAIHRLPPPLKLQRNKINHYNKDLNLALSHDFNIVESF